MDGTGKIMNRSQIDPVAVVALRRGPLGSRHRGPAFYLHHWRQVLTALAVGVALVVGFSA